jgi:glycosyltransferase involved in cell wall biosynthesis/Flp pilus assembly protein TadD
MPTLALSMIVKNGEATLARCLDSVRGVADEIVIADTGSSDRTIEIARQYGANVFSIPWENDFAKARNRSLAQVRSDWVLMMDADEMLSPDAVDLIPAHIEAKSPLGYTVVIRNYCHNVNSHLWDQKAQPNVDPPEFAKDYPAYLEHVNVRLFRRHPEVYYQGAVHETVGYRLFEMGARIDEARFLIHHFGFLDGDETRSNKSKLYRELGRQKIQELPDNALAYYELGIEEAEHFLDYEAALPLFKRTCELNPRFGPGWLFYGRTLGRLGRFQEALEALERASDTSVRRETLLEAVGDLQYSLGDFEKACCSYRQVLELTAERLEVESKLGFTEVRQGGTQEGFDRLQSVIDREPGNAEFHDRLIAGYVWMGELQKAAQAAEEKLDRVKPQPESFLRAASLRAQLQQWPRVVVLVRLGLDHFPDDSKLQQGLTEALTAVAAGTESEGDARFQAQDFESACRQYEQAIERVGKSPSITSKLGLAEVRLGRTQQGLAKLRAAVESNMQSPELRDRLIAACAWLGRLREAAAAAEAKIHAVEPEPKSYFRAASLRAQLREWRQAASIVSEGLAHFPDDENLLKAAAEIGESGQGCEERSLSAR